MTSEAPASRTSGAVARVVALGASNLTRGLHAVVATSRAAWGSDVEVVAALGHGRSYGSSSRVGPRTLPGILACGLWPSLQSLPPARTRALVTDVGNDILYGFSVEQILEWVDEGVQRLRAFSNDVVMTDLPLASIRSLSRRKFLAFRSILVPSCRLTLAQVQEAAERVNVGLGGIARARGTRFLQLPPEWYGFDPIHIRPGLWRTAWSEILGAPPALGWPRRWWLEGLRLYVMRPERQWLAGMEQLVPQRGVRLRAGGRVWLY